jgi:hypothetical protein
MKTDTDVVLAQDETGKIIFIKTFDLETERNEMIEAYKYVSELENCSYRMCGIERLNIEPYS